MRIDGQTQSNFTYCLSSAIWRALLVARFTTFSCWKFRINQPLHVSPQWTVVSLEKLTSAILLHSGRMQTFTFSGLNRCFNATTLVLRLRYLLGDGYKWAAVLQLLALYIFNILLFRYLFSLFHILYRNILYIVFSYVIPLFNFVFIFVIYLSTTELCT